MEEGVPRGGPGDWNIVVFFSIYITVRFYYADKKNTLLTLQCVCVEIVSSGEGRNKEMLVGRAYRKHTQWFRF